MRGRGFWMNWLCTRMCAGRMGLACWVGLGCWACCLLVMGFGFRAGAQQGMAMGGMQSMADMQPIPAPEQLPA